MPFSTLTRRELAPALFLSFFLSVFLASGFLPTSQQFFLKTLPYLGNLSPTRRRLGEMLAFPLLAALFHFSLPRRGKSVPPDLAPNLYLTLAAPVLISLVFGALLGGPTLVSSLATSEGRLELVWYLACIPVGEELLFRGWFYNIVDRVWPGKMASATNPLPVSVWMTALGFSIWHLQNLAHDSPGHVLFQVSYTFFTGLWLGYLRWKSGRLAWPIFGHFAINAACNVF